MTRIASTMWAPGEPCWSDVRVIDRREHSPRAFFARVLHEAPRYDALVVNGALGVRDGYRDLLCVALLALCRRRPAIVIAEATWEVGSAALALKLRRKGKAFQRMSRVAIRLIDRAEPTYCVLSRNELAAFPRTWQVAAERVLFTPFCSTLYGGVPDSSGGDYVFAGGDPLRDYDVLLRAAAGLNVRVRIAARKELLSLPPNVAAGPLPHEEFVAAMAGAAVVVVPLLGGTPRSSGHQTYLNSMLLGRPTIVTDAPGVRDYVRDGETGWISAAGDATALRDRIEWVLNPVNAPAVERVTCAAAAEVRERYLPTHYWCRLRDAAERAASISSGPDERSAQDHHHE